VLEAVETLPRPAGPHVWSCDGGADGGDTPGTRVLLTSAPDDRIVVSCHPTGAGSGKLLGLKRDHPKLNNVEIFTLCV